MLGPENYQVFLGPRSLKINRWAHIILNRKVTSLCSAKPILVESLCYLIIVCCCSSWISAPYWIVFEKFPNFKHFLFGFLNWRSALNNWQTLAPMDYCFFTVWIFSLVIIIAFLNLWSLYESRRRNELASVHGSSCSLHSSLASFSTRWRSYRHHLIAII